MTKIKLKFMLIVLEFIKEKSDLTRVYNNANRLIEEIEEYEEENKYE